MEGAGDSGGIENRDGPGLPAPQVRGTGGSIRGGLNRNGLRVELCDPPVVFAGRVGGDVGERLRIGRPFEFEDMQVGGSEENSR